MKSQEIMQEGPLDFMGKVGAGIAGAMSPTQTARGAWNVKAQEQQVADLAKKEFAVWNQMESDLLGNKVPAARLGEYLTNWARQTFELNDIPAFKGTYSQQAAMEYIKGAIRHYNTRHLRQQPAQPAQQGQQPQQPGQPPQPAQQGQQPQQPGQPQPQQPGQPTQQGQQPQQPGQPPQPAQKPQASPETAIFTDPEKFKAEWDKYVAAKSAGGAPYQLISDPNTLNVLKTIWKYGGGVRAESKKNKKYALTESKLMEDPIYRSFKSVGRILVEKKMSEQEILALFGQVEQAVSAGGSNRTLIGKGVDLASAINKAYQGVADKISRSGPVSGFDSAVDKLTDKLADAAGGQQGAVMTAIKKYRDFAKAHPIMQGAIYAGLIALTGLSGAGLGGAAILGGIKAFDKLLLGNKASSSLWSGFVTGATAYGLGQLKQAASGGGGTTPAPVGDDEFIPTRGPEPVGADEFVPTRGMEPVGADEFIPQSTSYTVKSGDTLSQIAQRNNVSVDELMQSNPKITNPDVIRAGQKIEIPAPTGSNVYQGGVGTNSDTMAKIASGQYTDSEISRNMASAAKGAAQNAPSVPTGGAELSQVGAKGGITLPSADGATAAGTSMSDQMNINQLMQWKANLGQVNHPGNPADWAAGNNPPPEWIKDTATGTYAPPGAKDINVFKTTPLDTSGSGTVGSPLNPGTAPLDAAGAPMKQVSFIDMTSGTSGTMNLPDGSSVPVSVFPEGGIQPRLPSGAEKIIADLNGNKVTAYVLNGRAYVPNFKMESFIIKKLPLNEIVDKKLTFHKWALHESLGRSRPNQYFLTEKGIHLVFENAERYQRIVGKIVEQTLKEAPPPQDMRPDRPDLPDEYRPDMPDAKNKGGLFGRAMAGLRNVGKQFTTKITAEKLKMNWHVKGKPTESDELWQFLVGEGVPEAALTDIWNQMSLTIPQGAGQGADTAQPEPQDQAQTTEPAQPTQPTQPTQPEPQDQAQTTEPAQPTQPAAAGTIFDDPRKFRAAWEAFADTQANLPIRVKGVVGDILKTALGKVESVQRKANIIKEAIRIKKELLKIKRLQRI